MVQLASLAMDESNRMKYKHEAEERLYKKWAMVLVDAVPELARRVWQMDSSSVLQRTLQITCRQPYGRTL